MFKLRWLRRYLCWKILLLEDNPAGCLGIYVVNIGDGSILLFVQFTCCVFDLRMHFRKPQVEISSSELHCTDSNVVGLHFTLLHRI